MKAEELLRQEFIGCEIVVVDALNKASKGIKGNIIDETKNSFLVQTEKGAKRLLKNSITFKTRLKTKHGEKTCIINGRLLQKRPHERIKLRIK